MNSRVRAELGDYFAELLESSLFSSLLFSSSSSPNTRFSVSFPPSFSQALIFAHTQSRARGETISAFQEMSCIKWENQLCFKYQQGFREFVVRGHVWKLNG